MRVDKIKIQNYKIFQDFSMSFNDDLNIIVGDNETGKSAFLEAIHLALTAQLSGRNIQYELSPYLFSIASIREYVESLQTNPATLLPEIYAERKGST